MSDVRLEFRDVTKTFQDRQGAGKTITAVEGVSLTVRDGEVVSLIGPSGCGKSTLLNMASGLNGTSDGKVFAAIFVLTVIGILAYWLVILVENRVLHYMPSREHGGF